MPYILVLVQYFMIAGAGPVGVQRPAVSEWILSEARHCAIQVPVGEPGPAVRAGHFGGGIPNAADLIESKSTLVPYLADAFPLAHC